MTVVNLSSRDREPLSPGDAAPAALPAPQPCLPRQDGAGGAAFFLSAPAMILLQAVAAHERQAAEAVVLELLIKRARAIGLSPLARAVADHPDTRQAQGP